MERSAGGGAAVAPRHDDWVSLVRQGYEVELVVYGDRMLGTVQEFSPDGLTVRIPVVRQTPDVRRFKANGTASVSLANGAATMPVAVMPNGELVRLQIIGPVDIVQRRRFVRVDIELPITVGWLDGAVGAWQVAASHTLDLSVGGTRVAFARSVWPSTGTAVGTSLELPAGTFEIPARVVGKTPKYDLRLEFADVPAAAAAALRTLVEG